MMQGDLLRIQLKVKTFLFQMIQFNMSICYRIYAIEFWFVPNDPVCFHKPSRCNY